MKLAIYVKNLPHDALKGNNEGQKEETVTFMIE